MLTHEYASIPVTFVFQDEQRLNLAYPFTSDFSETFAITGFTTLVFTLTVFGVSLGMWFMDPGRDSIIYRMTSQRIKKDQ